MARKKTSSSSVKTVKTKAPEAPGAVTTGDLKPSGANDHSTGHIHSGCRYGGLCGGVNWECGRCGASGPCHLSHPFAALEGEHDLDVP